MQTLVHKAEGRYLTFSVAREEYAVEVHRVREIVDSSTMELKSNPDSSLCGVLKLRDREVQVIDLTRRFSLGKAWDRLGGCVVTVLVKGWNGPLLMGLLVDGVREVIQVWTKDLENELVLEPGPRKSFLLGSIRCQDRLVHLLDADQLAVKEEALVAGEILDPAKPVSLLKCPADPIDLESMMASLASRERIIA